MMKFFTGKKPYVLLFITWCFSFTTQAAVLNYNFTIDVTDSDYFSTIFNTQNIIIPLSGDNSMQYQAGDTLHVVVDFNNNQRLQLSTAGDPGWGDTESIGLFVVDTTNAYDVSGTTSTDFNILEPEGELFDFSFSQNNVFSLARGAFVSFSSDLTDSSFSASGFEFMMTVNSLSESIEPNQLRLRFVNLDLEPLVVPIPPAFLLFASALVGLFRIKRTNRLRS